MWRHFLSWLGLRPRDQGEGSAGTARDAEQFLLRRRAQPLDPGPPMSQADQALRRADAEIRGMRRRRNPSPPPRRQRGTCSRCNQRSWRYLDNYKVWQCQTEWCGNIWHHTDEPDRGLS